MVWRLHLGVAEVREIPFCRNGIDRLREVTDVTLDNPDIIFQDQYGVSRPMES